MNKDVMIVTGAGQIGMAIARRVGFGKKIILGDKSIKNAETVAKIMNDAGYDVVPFEMDLSSRESVLAIIEKAQEYGEIKLAGISVYGCGAFIKRGFPGYMTGSTMFAFFDYSEPLVFFILDYLAVMILFMAVGCLVIRILNKVDEAQKKKRRIEK